MRPWKAYVGAFLLVWAVLMFAAGYWPEVVKQWPMSIVMIFGSLVAGSTPMGGGAIAFPFLVLVMGTPPEAARNFGLVIQALGMTSAMLFILCRRVKIQSRVLAFSALGSAFGMALGAFVLAPVVPNNYVKLVFACLWMSFAILTLAKNREFCSLSGAAVIPPGRAAATGLIVGFLGGTIAAMIGVGLEMLLYTVLVLLYRNDLKVAIPTAVSAMAIASVMGAAIHAWMGDIPRDVMMKFLAAGPIVVFGAPIGTWIVSVIPRVRTLYFVSFLCVVQFVWTLSRIDPGPAEWSFVAAAMAAASGAFYWLYRTGRGRL